MSLDDDTLVLRSLRDSDERPFLEAVKEWPPTEEMEFAPKYAAIGSFNAYLDRTKAFAAGIDLPEGWVPSVTLFGFVGETIVGRLQLRLRLNDFLWKVGGQIGYVVLPRFRRRGYARSMLRQGLERARVAGMKRVLITCDPTNAASRR
ncbi:MAG TPA: GNAT family N-acetyltransferase, partial [Thermoanaerobaculia bacterium]|nr:GNAT family N-acetyltransferase [Thermoanaerobaculia bacterium]